MARSRFRIDPAIQRAMRENVPTPDQLRRIREGMGWTSTDAASKVGVSANTWQRWERGEVKPIHLRAPLLFRLLRQVERKAALREASE